MTMKRTSSIRNFGMAALLAVAGSICAAAADNADRIQPWSENPSYWQYKGQPVLLLGGTDDDNLFQWAGKVLSDHLDLLQSVGGNYIRNTMSDRDEGNIYAFKQLPDGNYDLDQWNEEYWRRFQDLLKGCHERDIVVQIEVWDRFDVVQENWLRHPWNPGNNVSYTYEQTGFTEEYRAHANSDLQPFFHSIPGMPQYSEKLDVVRGHQERYVAKMLSYSLGYGNVLYCMNNETSTPAAWGQHWIKFIQAKAAEKGVLVQTTDMFDDAYRGPEATNALVVNDDPEHYTFVDISQVNGRNFNDTHWDQLQWLLEQAAKHPRPRNHTKIYGGGYYGFGTGGFEDGIERFWRNILGGSASSRFHRPDAGNGLNDFAKGSIRAARLVEDQIKFWDIEPHQELLSGREPNEAYLAAKPGEKYVLYFTNGGSVDLDLSKAPGTFAITWISVAQGVVTENKQASPTSAVDKTLEGGGVVTLSTPYKGGWVAAIVKQ